MGLIRQPSDLLAHLHSNLLNMDAAHFVDNFIVGEEDMEMKPEAREAVLEVFDALASDALFCAANLLGIMGIHFWTPLFPSIFTLILQFYVRGFVASYLSGEEINSHEDAIIGHLVNLGQLLDEQGIVFEVDEDEWQIEEVDNPFTSDEGKADK